MTINYTTLLGLAKPVTGTESGQWGDVVNDQITTLVEDAVANASSISVTAGNVTLTTTTGAANQARMSTLIITGSPGTTRNVVAPSQAKVYVVINQSNAAVVVKGAATTGVTIGAGQTAQIAWNGSDFVEIGNYVHGNFVVNGNLSVNGNSTLGDGGADITTINGQFVGANANISKATTLSTSAPAFFWLEGATYTDTGTAGGTTQPHATFHQIDAPTVNTSNIVTYTNASTLYIAGAPSAAGSATITNPYALFINGGASYFGAAVTMAATTQNLALGTSQTSGTWTAGGAAQTGTITLDQSTKAHTLNLGTGATENATTKTINLGTAGVSGSTTTINIGSAVSGSTTSVTINGGSTTTGAVTYSATTQNIALGTSQTSGTWTAGGAAQTGTLTLDQSTKAHTLNLGTGATENATTKTINIGTAGVAGSTTNLTYGSGVASSTTTHIWNSGGTEGMRLNSTGLGIGTSSPGVRVDASGQVRALEAGTGSGNGGLIGSTASADGNAGVLFQTNSASRWNLTTAGTAGANLRVYNYALGSTVATFDSSGNLGIGTSSPGAKLHVAGTFRQNDATTTYGYTVTTASSKTVTAALFGGGYFAWQTNNSGTDQLILDTSGNLGLGVTPSAWSIIKAIEIGSFRNSVFSDNGSASVGIASGSYYNAGWKYALTGSAVGRYEVAGNEHRWFNATSGTAGNAITFTQAMTLDASGNLLVGTIATGAAGIGISNGANLTFTEGSGASYVNLFRQSNSAATVLANGYKYTSTVNGFASSTGVSWAKSAVVLDTGSVIFYANGATTVANGTDVTPTERARITSGGDLQAYGAVSLWPSSSGGAGSYSIKRAATNALTINDDFAGQERLRITSGGDLLVGTATTSGAGGITLFNNGSTGFSFVNNNNASATGYVFSSYRRSSTEIGSVTQNGTTAVLFNTTSDRRLKNNIVPAPSASAVIDAIEIVSHDWKSAPDEHVTYGVIAQDLALVAPQAVLQGDDGDEIEKAWGVDYSKLVPMLIKEIQSLRARVAALESQP